MFGGGPDEDEDFSVIPLEHNFRNTSGVQTFVHSLGCFLKNESGDEIRSVFGYYFILLN
jgi:hypothetical protein